MKVIKKAWLEVLFAIILIIIIYLSAAGNVHYFSVASPRLLAFSYKGTDGISFDKYMEGLEDDQHSLVVITLKGSQGTRTSREMAVSLKNLGLKKAYKLLLLDPHCYIGILYNGDVIYECASLKGRIRFGDYINKHYLLVSSSDSSDEDSDGIFYDDVQYSVNKQGFNIVVIDTENRVLTDSVNYDVLSENVSFYRMTEEELADPKRSFEARK